MPQTLDYEPTFVTTNKVVAPIPGNAVFSACCRIPGSNQALWLTVSNGEWQVWITTEGYVSLASKSGSVEYLSTILADPDGPIKTSDNGSGAIGSLTVVGGIIYATVTGYADVTSNGIRYARIYRSADGGATWTFHASLPGENTGTRGDMFSGNFGGCELLIDGSTWCTTYPIWGALAAGYPSSRMGVAHSTDGGLTWTQDLNLGWYIIGGIYGTAGSRQIARWQGSWYIGGRGNVDPGEHYRSTDLINWTDIGSLGHGNTSSRELIIATPTKAYGLDSWPGAGGGSYNEATLVSTTDPNPITSSTPWSGRLDQFFDLGSSIANPDPWVSDLNPDTEDPARHLWVVVGRGVLRAISPIDQPVTRQWPRDDGRGASSATRIIPSPAGRSRIIGGMN